ncbi:MULTISPECIES: ATP-binding protein [Phenylobacterium]|uniref:histidine kinase n=1 Tax=Phenylobacterium koreense TaxID=266125 RepID=A0ABV2EFI1_9CAUL
MNSWTAFGRALGLESWRDTPASPAAANLRNMLLLTQLRWLAVVGQLVTIAVVEWGLGIRLPLFWLLLAPAGLTLVNLISVPILHRRRGASDQELLFALLIDVGALTWQLFLSGGATNPFAPLFLMQVVLGAVLLSPAYAWLLILVTSFCFAALGVFFEPLILPAVSERGLFGLYLQGSLACFVLIAVLLVLFVTRISQNLKARDAYLAGLRQQAAEQNHIVRMGLLASGAAHELGTPLASISVILSDWKRLPALADEPEIANDIAEMQVALERCKAIVTGILMSAGEARGEAPERTTLRAFLSEVVAEWQATHCKVVIELRDGLAEDPPIISDTALKQVFSALFDNAAEAGARRVELWTALIAGELVITIADDGRGFPPEILERLGQPYQSTKGKPGAGLGLFLLVNVLRTLGGSVSARARPGGGAEVRLSLPLASLAPLDNGGSHGR